MTDIPILSCLILATATSSGNNGSLGILLSGREHMESSAMGLLKSLPTILLAERTPCQVSKSNSGVSDVAFASSPTSSRSRFFLSHPVLPSPASPAPRSWSTGPLVLIAVVHGAQPLFGPEALYHEYRPCHYRCQHWGLRCKHRRKHTLWHICDTRAYCQHPD